MIPSKEKLEEMERNLQKDCHDPLDASPLTPVGFRVLVRRDPPPQKIGMIWISDDADEKTEGQFATVLALGAGKDFDGKPVEGRFPVKIGDRVCLFQHGGSQVKNKGFADGLHYLIEVPDLLGIVEEVPDTEGTKAVIGWLQYCRKHGATPNPDYFKPGSFAVDLGLHPACLEEVP